MKVLMISRDEKVLERGSVPYRRMQEYRTLFDDLKIVIMRGNIFSFLMAFAIAGRIAKDMNKSDWVTSQDPFEAGIVALVISKVFGLKLQLQLHTDVFDPHFKRHSIMNKFRVFLAKALLPHADSVRVVSERIKHSLTEHRILNTEYSKVHVLPIFVDINQIKSQPIKFDLRERFPEFEKIIIIVARLEREKNISLALEAFQKILKNVPKAGLVIFGTGSEESRLKNYAKKLGISDSVKFDGWTNDPVSAYKSANLLLVTSLYEGYGMNIIEALACGCPVVSNDVGIAADAGAVIVSDLDDMVLKVVRLMSDEAKAILNSEFVITKQEYLQRFKQTFS